MTIKKEAIQQDSLKQGKKNVHTIITPTKDENSNNYMKTNEKK